MDNSTPTIGASYLQHRVTQDGVDLSLQIWDTAGQVYYVTSMNGVYIKCKILKSITPSPRFEQPDSYIGRSGVREFGNVKG